VTQLTGAQPDAPRRDAPGALEEPCVPADLSACDAAGDDDITKDVGWLVGQIQHGYLTTASAAIDSLPGGLRGLRVLGDAIRGKAPNQIEVARRFGIDRTVMVRLVDDMEKAGLVERQPDPADRRARRIVGTERGRAAYEDAQTRLRLVEDHVLAPLSADERAVFTAMARRVVEHLVVLDPTQVESACQAATRQLDQNDPLPGAAG
jgi:DNA-binding MarR family transcriptional regulator